MNPMEWYGVESMMKHFTDLVDASLSSLEAKIQYGFNEMEVKLETLRQSVDDLRAAVDGVAARVDGQLASLVDSLESVTSQLDAERQAAVELAAAEDAEDVAQNQALADAQAATDATLAEARAAADEISAEVSRLNSIAAEEEPVDEEPPVEEPPVEEQP